MKRSLGLCLSAAICAAAQMVCTSANAEDRRFALSVFHFNVQYVAGGLTGFLTSGAPDPNIDLTAEDVEDRIIVESFEPLLDMFMRHPSWGADLEMQGYMIEVMAERHPAVLDKLRALAQSGQVDVLSFHFSDQLFLAYPKSDWQWSVRQTRRTFEENDIPLSSTVFCQEGQSGPGIAKAMDQGAAFDLRTTFRGEFDITIQPSVQSGFDDEGLVGPGPPGGKRNSGAFSRGGHDDVCHSSQ